MKKMDKNNNSNDCVSILEELNAEFVDLYLPVMIYLLFSLILGLLGNSFLTYIHFCKFDETATKVFIIGLFVCDFLTCLICIPMEFFILCFSFTFHSSFACRLIRFFVAIAMFNSSIILFLLGIERYIVMCRPFKYNNISVVTSKKILASSTISSAILNIPVLEVYNTQNRLVRQCGNIGKVCSFPDSLDDTVFPFVYYCVVLCGYLYLLIFLMIFYLLIELRIKKIQRSMRSNRQRSSVSFGTPSKIPSFNDKNEGNVSETKLYPVSILKKHSVQLSKINVSLLPTTLLWAICYLLHFIAIFWRMFEHNFNDTESDRKQILYKLLIYSFYLKCAVNPYLYGTFNRQFYSELQRLFQKAFQLYK
ncbi:arg8-vasotocin receptor [Octopus bimaculoides]|uniref:G-protein coupled receptors family 1 profile domain-containing protein n=1 Tax=Octopus bimaculoides TaxID=37653 RepID=A0A0L8HZ00_OCTBM|nr:arg8-vasotocin receptor [Octopus bimaculoides]XP_014768520.1 arg8-vasotocin receptor [Octopus bimaculoides]|eukprot:XP_014768519.1 PREDICTED: arg8-vasotocin receptor-like [Octopus bimaculoides]